MRLEPESAFSRAVFPLRKCSNCNRRYKIVSFKALNNAFHHLCQSSSILVYPLSANGRGRGESSVSSGFHAASAARTPTFEPLRGWDSLVTLNYVLTSHNHLEPNPQSQLSLFPPSLLPVLYLSLRCLHPFYVPSWKPTFLSFLLRSPLLLPSPRRVASPGDTGVPYIVYRWGLLLPALFLEYSCI